MAENNRVLNHSEFAAKYNQQSEQDIAASYSEIQSASDNFQEGFDDSTYEEGQSGPKRPLNQGSEETPDAPDSMPTPTEGMAAPTDTEEVEDDHVTPDEVEDEEFEEGDEPEMEVEDDFEDDGSGDPEAEEDDEDEEEEDDEDEEEETNESLRIAKNTFLLESFDDFEARGPIPSGQPHGDMYSDELETIELDFEGADEEDDEECFVTCKSCGAKKEIERGSYPMGMKNQNDPNSWWQGAKMGMMCESCNG